MKVAKDAAEFLKPGQIYVDLNSVSLDSKKEIDAEISKSGADFVEAAVMAAVKTQRLKTPILLGGPRAVGVGGHPEDVDVPGADLHDEQHVDSPEVDAVDVEEIRRQQAPGLGA